ncbi:outer membrane lipoprotein chaperone LolA [Pseudoxanthomonas dokdonensis]|uniref:Outer-membrane lipoprotein carrier protein n=1 Tax=Pseudoxanthomonas dokdonensis TaxID=344882 RepID=A0A0R0CX15_9GAMM|nr:outer membrane lipoprotein chaperone LolA [Pseudoxanthomonas dokdonensis]KRG70679.1 membrane protein [Pseudoxanthomonas dokdonensis]
MLRIVRLAVVTSGLLAGSLVASHAQAGANDDLKAFTQGLKGLDGQFTQQVFDGGGKLKETSSGRVALAVPNQFRWEYAKPFPQLIVADGKKVWLYDPDLQQVTVRDQGSEEQNTPLAALLDPGALARQFHVIEEPAAKGLEWMTLEPKDEGMANFHSARLGFKGNSLAQMEVVDVVGQRTVVQFNNWQRNPAFARGTFNYTPGKGVDVVGDE